MSISTKALLLLNRYLQHVNLRLETLTAKKREFARLNMLRTQGYFENPVFPVLDSFVKANVSDIFGEVVQYHERFNTFLSAECNDVGFSYKNNYFSSPDSEILYTMIRRLQPERIIEIGCGNSTRIMRQAVLDGKISTQIIAIDPHPRTEIEEFVDESYRIPVQSLLHDKKNLFRCLQSGDILFIDSSHEIRTGNDVIQLYLQVLPQINSGVFVHIHDIFLPYEYPHDWIVKRGWGWNEQYLIQALLSFSTSFEVAWPGYYIQRNYADFAVHFPHMQDHLAKSLWIRKLT